MDRMDGGNLGEHLQTHTTELAHALYHRGMRFYSVLICPFTMGMTQVYPSDISVRISPIADENEEGYPVDALAAKLRALLESISA